MTSGQRVLFYIYTSGEVLFFWIFFLKDDLIFTIFFLVNFPFYFLMSHCFLIFAFILVCVYNLFFIIATPKSKPTSLNQNQTSNFFSYFTVIFPLYIFTFVLSSLFILLDNKTFRYNFLIFFHSNFFATRQICLPFMHISQFSLFILLRGVLGCGASASIAERCRADPPHTLCS